MSDVFDDGGIDARKMMEDGRRAGAKNKRVSLISIDNGLIQTGALYELCETDSMRRVLLYLISISINGKLKYDPYGIYKNYYLKGTIAACAPYSTIMSKCHLSDRKNFMKTLRKLESSGFIERKKAQHYYIKGYSQNVYVLGWRNKETGWKQLYLMDAFYKMHPEKAPGNS